MSTRGYVGSGAIRSASKGEYVNWLNQLKWDIFGTVTFPIAVGDQQADATFKSFINNIEHAIKSRVACVFGKEFESKRLGRVGVHFHFAMKALRPIPRSVVIDGWRKLVRTSHNRNDESIRVADYNPIRAGLDYILKMSDGYRGEWDFHNLQFFIPDAIETVSQPMIVPPLRQS